MSTVNITYLHHSGFAAQVEDKLLLFDYFGGGDDDSLRDQGIKVLSQAINDPKVNEVFVFVSHGHRDHFDPGIFAFQNLGKKTRYILSDDVMIKTPEDNHFFIARDQTMDCGQVKIETFGSTDEGVSFLVRIGDVSLLHAGDLNWWYWHDESTAEELQLYENDFKSIMEKIEGKKIDIAFFPVDPRLKEYGHHGGDYFIKTLKPKAFFPMHFWNDFAYAQAFAEKWQKRDHGTIVHPISKPLQNFEIDL